MRRTLIALFAVYLVMLAWLILYKFEVPYIGDAWQLDRPWKLVPFLPSGDANVSNPLEVLANVVFFVPFGLYLALLAPRWRWWHVGLAALGASVVLEVTQHLLSVGSFDSTDVIANTAGAIAGLALARLVAPATLTRILLIGSAVAMIAVVAYLASPFSYHAPRDVVVEPR